MYSLYKEFKHERISLAYFGVFTNRITRMLVELSEDYLSKNKKLRKEISKKASFLLIESFQNVIKHGLIEKAPISELKYNRDFFQIKILADRIIFSSANIILQKDTDYLKAKIDYINSLDRSKLRELRNEILMKGDLSEKGGAGIGLIEMVRKTGLPLLYKIVHVRKGYSLLFLSMELPTGLPLIEHEVDINQIERVYEQLVEADILILYKGDFSDSTNERLIGMLENNFLREGYLDSDKVKNIVTIIELMQNISKHGKRINGYKEGIFTLYTKNEDIFIECNNFVKNEEYDTLRKRLKKIKLHTKAELEKEYRHKLKNSYLLTEGAGGLGLYEIARFSNNTFTYDFVETEDNEIYFSIKVKTV